MKRISLEKIESQYKITSYQKLHKKVMELMEEEKIKPVKASGTNGKKPALYKEYWIIETPKDNSSLIEELSYMYVPSISTDYYLKHFEQYRKDRSWVILLNQYLKTNREELKTPQSINERSFAIWKREKFLKEEQGKKILKRCGISMEMLNLYETTEPLSYYVYTREVPQNMLIAENKDTFYSMRRHLMSEESREFFCIKGRNQMFLKNDYAFPDGGKVSMPEGKTILGMPVGTLIYGAGKGILRSFEDFNLCAEPYMRAAENKIYYFGDLDYEGIGIYEKLATFFENHCTIRPFREAYLKMIEKANEIGIESMPLMKAGQNQNIGEKFWSFFEKQDVEKMQKLLQQGRYIPQEILSVRDF